MFVSMSPTGNNIGNGKATSMSEALKTNTTLTKLDLGCKHKRNKTLIFIFIRSIGSNIGDIGATSMSEALKTNTTLAKLDLGCKHKRNEHKLHQTTISSFYYSNQ